MSAALLTLVLAASDVVAVRADFTGGTVCSTAGWCWEFPKPQGFILFSFWGSAADDVWAAGERGTLMHFDGRGWSGRAELVAEDLLALWGSGPRDVWASGRGGVLLHFDGETWRRSDSGTTEPLWAFAGRGPNDVFAVGGTAALHFDGEGWERVQVPDGAGFSSVWIEGREVFAQGSAVFRLVAGRFERVQSWSLGEATPVPGPARHRFAYKPQQLFERRGGELAPLDQVEGTWSSAPDRLWTQTLGGEALRHDGQGWSRFKLPGPVRVIWERTPDDVWAASLSGPPIHFDGKTWSLPDAPCGGGHPQAMATIDGALWLTTWEGPICVLGASGWRTLPVQVRAAKALSGTSENDVWFASGSSLYRWNGEFLADARQTPGRMPAENLPALSGVHARSPREVWAVGGHGLVLRWDGETWARVAVPPTSALRVAWGDARGGLWLMGDYGAALRRSSAGFSQVVLPPLGRPGVYRTERGTTLTIDPNAVGNVTGIAGAGPDDVWAVGAPGGSESTHCGGRDASPSPVDWGRALLHWDGKTWSALPTGDITRLDSVWVRGKNDVWAVGQKVLLHYDGKTLTKLPLNGGRGVRDRFALSGTATDLFILGDGIGLRRWPLPPVGRR
ncbi:MAG: hypothetical protein JNK82_06590 [Myxococcaceae bacterium]|nr:hypothetical protein [Myxococcaceae bacterium]